MYLLKTRLSLFRFFPGASALPLILVSVICFSIICIAGHKSISQTFFLIPAVCIFLFGCTVTAEFPQSYIEFGLWPQSLKAENVKITEEQTKINGFSAFKGSDNNFYIKVESAESYSSERNKYKFQDGTEIENGKEYFFRLEPIKWRILSGSGTEKALLFSEKIITGGIKFYKLKDSERYYKDGTGYLYNPREINGNEIQPNNYEFSEVRAFLNGLNGESYGVSDFSEKGFFDIAFSEEEKKSILTSKIDNSLNSTTDYTGTWKKAYGYASNDTEDKIFLLSEYEITNPSYGFKNYDESDVFRKKTVTDYAKASGAFAWMSDDEFYNLGIYYLRSPFSAKANYCIQDVNQYGDAKRTHEIIYPPTPSVCPAMFINMK